MSETTKDILDKHSITNSDLIKLLENEDNLTIYAKPSFLTNIVKIDKQSVIDDLKQFTIDFRYTLNKHINIILNKDNTKTVYLL